MMKLARVLDANRCYEGCRGTAPPPPNSACTRYVLLKITSWRSSEDVLGIMMKLAAAG